MNHRVRQGGRCDALITTVRATATAATKTRIWVAAGAARLRGKRMAGTVKHGDDSRSGGRRQLSSRTLTGLPGYLYICERGENKIRRLKLW